MHAEVDSDQSDVLDLTISSEKNTKCTILGPELFVMILKPYKELIDTEMKTWKFIFWN